MSRIDHLLTRELDGELSALERAELERTLRLNGSARKERAVWARVQAGLRSIEPPSRINTRKMSAAIVSELPRRRTPTRLIFAAAAAVLVLAFIQPRVSTVKRSSANPLAAAPSARAPVMVYVEDGALEDEPEPVPVEIRF